MAKKTKIDSKELFDSYYREIYGERWECLKEAMLKPSNPISLSDKLLTPYYLDQASITAAESLPIEKGDNVLDMCAAPGGKTLSIALRLDGEGHLVSNDRSPARRQRLKNVIDSCLDERQKSIITVTGHDSTKWGLYEKDMYDKILLDAPCSSERHVLKDEAELSKWSANRPKVIALNQFAMLAAALDAVKVGGLILYSTCSINPEEDDKVIEKLFRKRSDKFELIQINSNNNAEKTQYGNIILPDRANGEGPLFFTLIRRTR